MDQGHERLEVELRWKGVGEPRPGKGEREQKHQPHHGEQSGGRGGGGGGAGDGKHRARRPCASRERRWMITIDRRKWGGGSGEAEVGRQKWGGGSGAVVVVVVRLTWSEMLVGREMSSALCGPYVQTGAKKWNVPPKCRWRKSLETGKTQKLDTPHRIRDRGKATTCNEDEQEGGCLRVCLLGGGRRRSTERGSRRAGSEAITATQDHGVTGHDSTAPR